MLELMVGKKIWSAFALSGIIFFGSCNFSSEPVYLGKLSIRNIDSVFFKVYQAEDFDSSVGIYFEIVNKEDSILCPMNFLIGTSDFDRSDTKDFFTGSQDSIIYLSFLDSNTVYTMYDLRSQKTCCNNSNGIFGVDSSLDDRLKSANARLKFY
jgi:hypothetical protein